MKNILIALFLFSFIATQAQELEYQIFKNQDFTQEERCKINLILALYSVYKANSNNEDTFVQHLNLFYQNIGFHKTSFITGIFGEDVENTLHKRIQIDNNIITKNFNVVYFSCAL